MDELMVQDESMIPDVQAEITLGEDSASDMVVELQSSESAVEEPGDVKNDRRGKLRRGSGIMQSDLAEDIGVIVRSSGRNSRKKIDPDFCYDNSLAFVGATRKRAPNKSPSSSGASSSHDKPVNDGNVEKSKSSLEDTSSSLSQASADDPCVFENEHKTPGSFTSSEKSSTPATSKRTSRSSGKAAKDACRTDSGSVGGVNAEGDPDSMDPTKLYCICRKPYDNRFMISCDKCEEWYHGLCVGVSKAQGKLLDKKKLPWLCPTCRSATSPNQLTSTPITDKSDEIETDVVLKRDIPPVPEITAIDEAPTVAAQSPVEVKPPIVDNKAPKKLKTPVQPQRPSFKMKPKKQSEPKPKPEKVEELPAEANNDGLELMALGKPQQTGTRALARHSRPSEIGTPRLSRQRSSTSNHDSPKPNSAASVFFSKPATPVQVTKHEPKPVEPKRKLQPGTCYMCSEMARDNSLFCSSNCILRHGTDALCILENSTSEHVMVLEKHTGKYLKGDDAPTRGTLLAWLEGHQTYYVPIKAELREVYYSRKKGQPEEDPVRASTRMMLKDHLMTRYKDAPDLHEEYQADAIAKVAEDMEAGLFHHFGEPNVNYKKKYRVIVLNITDKKNDSFFRRLIRREIELDKVADLTPDDMASDKLVKWRQNEIKKGLEMIIQTQPEEPTPQLADFKTLERGDEVLLSEDLVTEEKNLDDEGTNLNNLITDNDPAEHEYGQFAENALKTPVFFRQEDEHFMSSPDESKGGAEYSPTKSKPSDSREYHDEHIFDANCSICNESLHSSSGKSQLMKDSPRDAMGFARIKPEATTYLSPTVSTFKPSFSNPACRIVKTETSPLSDSPGSSISDYSPGTDDLPGVIWQGEVNTIDLPVVKLHAYSVCGKATEFMKELPRKLRQLGRLQPQQLWPYLDEVKPLKDVAVVMLKSPGDRASNEFSSLHYFLTTRGRVSVLGPIPKTFKDFYMIAVKENEPLPSNLRDLPDCELDATHPKIFLGIIVHHRAPGQVIVPPANGRGFLDTPVKHELKKIESPYESPKTPNSGDNSPLVQTSVKQTSLPKNDPIVSKFLGISAAVPKAEEKSPDTSEPMEIDEDDNKVPSAAPYQQMKKVAFTVPSIDTSKNSREKKENSLSSSSGAASSKTASPLVDPRLARFQSAKPAAIASETISSPKSDPEFAVWPSKTADSTGSSSADSREEKPVDDNDGFGFSQKFIENLHKINLPPGLKEALQSISTPNAKPEKVASVTSSQYQIPPPGFPQAFPPGGPSLPGPGLMGPRPMFDRPPPFTSFPTNTRPDFRGPEGPHGELHPHAANMRLPPPGWQPGVGPAVRPNFREFERNPPSRDGRQQFHRDQQPDNHRFTDRAPSGPRDREERWSARDRHRDNHNSGVDNRRTWNRTERRRTQSRSRSRTRSPIRRRKPTHDAEDRESRVSSRKSEPEKIPSEGVDEFGRDLSLRFIRKKSEDRSSGGRKSHDSRDRNEMKLEHTSASITPESDITSEKEIPQ